MFKASVIILFLYFCDVIAQNNSELLAVIVLFRHGDRAPKKIYKNDPYDESYWPNGLGQLTNIGKKQHYDLGLWYRERYKTFLPSRYSNEFFRIESSNADRCVMSAQSHLAGFLPPQGEEIWNENLLWQPIPVHSISKGKDPYLAQDYYCPKYYNLYDELMKTDEFQAFFEEHSELFRNVSEKSGENITTLLDLYEFYNILYIEKVHGLILPDWAEDIYPTLQEIANNSWTSYTYTEDLSRLWTGPLLDHIAGNFEAHLNNETSDIPKYLVLSGHETNIATLLNPLKLFDYLSPEYASSMIFELKRGNEIDPFVNIFYKNSTFIKNLTLEGCDFDCDFVEFQNIIRPIRMDFDTWKKECNE